MLWIIIISTGRSKKSTKRIKAGDKMILLSNRINSKNQQRSGLRIWEEDSF